MRRIGDATRAMTLALLACLGCAGTGPAFETVTTLPAPASHPAGTDIELDTELPTAEERGSTASGLVVLETPADPAAARAVVAAFFRAVVEESPRALAALLGRNATMQNGPRRESIASVFASRFTRFDYQSLAGETLYRDSDVKVWPDDGDFLVRTPLDITWGTRPRMFGDELTFRLTPGADGFRITELVEEFRNP